MQKVSTLYRTILSEGMIATILSTAPLVNAAKRRHGLNQTFAAKLGEAMALCAYVASFLKDEKSYVNLSISASQKISVTCDSALRLSGHIEAAEKGGKGVFSLTRFDGGIPDTGTSETEGDDLELEFSRYYRISEQRLAHAVLFEKFEKEICTAAGGIILEALPGADPENFERLKNRLPEKEELIRRNPDELFFELFGTAQSERKISFACRCTKKKAALAVLSLGKEDALALLKEQNRIEVRCPDCGKTYLFSEDEMTELFERNGR